MDQTDRGPEPPPHQGEDDFEHEEAPNPDDALAHTDMDWNDPEMDRAVSRREERLEHNHHAEEEA